MPLKRRMKLKKNENSWCWVNFKYEGVPTFCFICGFIGHNEMFSEKLFKTPMEQIEKSYGVWMRADPMRKTHTIGSKWLRQSSGVPVAMKTEEGGEKGLSVEGGRDEHNPINFGEASNRKVQQIRDNSTVNQQMRMEYDKANNIQIPENQQYEKIGAGTKNSNISDSLTIVDQKGVEQMSPMKMGPKQVTNRSLQS